MRIRFLRPAGAFACLSLLATTACKLVNTAVDVPGNIAADLAGKNETPKPKIAPTALQTGVMRFADTFSSRMTQATREFAEKAGTPEARIQALSWSTGQSTSAYTIATGSNPNLAVLDMLVLVSLGRMVHEEYWMPKVWGEADRPMVEAFSQLEIKAWEVANQLLNPAQQEAVRERLRQWRDEHPEMGVTAFVKLPVFQDLVTTRPGEGEKKGPNLSELLSIDPLGGLEPAVRELEQARLLAERTVFYLQRAPILLQDQVELLTLRLMNTGEVRGVLSDSERVSKAAESLAETAAALPAEFARQRAGLVADLEKAEEPARKLLAEARATLEAGTQMSAALQAATTTLDKFIARFEEPPAPEGSPPAATTTAEEPGKPFDVSEYGTAAREIAGMLQTLDGELPKLQRAIDEAAAQGERTIDYAFRRALQLGLLLIAAGALAFYLSRRLSQRPRA